MPPKTHLHNTGTVRCQTGRSTVRHWGGSRGARTPADFSIKGAGSAMVAAMAGEGVATGTTMAPETTSPNGRSFAMVAATAAIGISTGFGGKRFLKSCE